MLTRERGRRRRPDLRSPLPASSYAVRGRMGPAERMEESASRFSRLKAVRPIDRTLGPVIPDLVINHRVDPVIEVRAVTRLTVEEVCRSGQRKRGRNHAVSRFIRDTDMEV